MTSNWQKRVEVFIHPSVTTHGYYLVKLYVEDSNGHDIVNNPHDDQYKKFEGYVPSEDEGIIDMSINLSESDAAKAHRVRVKIARAKLDEYCNPVLNDNGTIKYWDYIYDEYHPIA